MKTKLIAAAILLSPTLALAGTSYGDVHYTGNTVTGCVFDSAVYNYTFNIGGLDLSVGSNKMPVGIQCTAGTSYVLSADPVTSATAVWLGPQTTNLLGSRVNANELRLFADDNAYANRLATDAGSRLATGNLDIVNLGWYQFNGGNGVDWGYTKAGVYTLTTTLQITY